MCFFLKLFEMSEYIGFELTQCSECKQNVLCLFVQFDYCDYNDMSNEFTFSICKDCFLEQIIEEEKKKNQSL